MEKIGLEGLIVAIMAGTFDNELDNLIGVMQRRQGTITGSILPGDTVVFNDKVRPRYLTGLCAKVVRVNTTTVTVETPDATVYSRFAGMTKLRVPREMIGKQESR